MSQETTHDRPVIYTVGHSNHPLDRLTSLLQEHSIEALVDTRSSPYSRYAPHFNSSSLKELIPRSGIRYVFMGKELGGRPEGDHFYDEQGHVLYSLVAESPLFLEGVEKLIAGARRYRVALLCSEENPSVCHRRLLITRVLRERGIGVQHIRGDGALQPEEALLEEEAEAKRSAQLSLFEPEKPEEWKSLQPVQAKRGSPGGQGP